MELIDKYKRLKGIIRGMERVVVAFSGGIDSTLLLRACIDAIGRENVLALIGSSPVFPKREIKDAETIANTIGSEYLIEDIPVMLRPEFVKNDRQRCYYCKDLLFEKARNIAIGRGFTHVAEGSNKDDMKESRPGRRACIEQEVVSPLILAEMTKKDIRELSRILSLPNHDRPAFPCLATRIPYGTPIDAHLLKRIELSEDFIKGLGITQIRVRCHGSIARIEVAKDEATKIIENREKIVQALLHFGFIYITLDLEGYRTGSMDILPLHSI